MAYREPEDSARSLLARVRIASPCEADWNAMAGDHRVRHCYGCGKDVFDLSAMTRREAEELLALEQRRCVRFYQRADGRVLTADCPVGSERAIARILLIALAVGISIGTMWALTYLLSIHPYYPRPIMGKLPHG